MNLGGAARTDRILDELGGRQKCSATADDQLLAALAAWVDEIDDVPVVRARGRHRAARGGRLHRILGGGAVVIATFSGASVAAALTGAQVPGMTSFGQAVVDLVPGDDLFAQDPGGPQGPGTVTSDEPWAEGTSEDVQGHEASAPGSGASERDDARESDVPGTRTARWSTSHGLTRVPDPARGDDPAQGDEQPGGDDRTTPPGQVAGQTGPPEQAKKDQVPGQEKQQDQPSASESARPTGPPEQAKKDLVPGQEKRGYALASASARPAGPPEQAKKDQVPGQEKRDVPPTGSSAPDPEAPAADPETPGADPGAGGWRSGEVPVAVLPGDEVVGLAPPEASGTTSTH